MKIPWINHPGNKSKDILKKKKKKSETEESETNVNSSTKPRRGNLKKKKYPKNEERLDNI